MPLQWAGLTISLSTPIPQAKGLKARLGWALLSHPILAMQSASGFSGKLLAVDSARCGQAAESYLL